MNEMKITENKGKKSTQGKVEQDEKEATSN